jgi:hypothetical protein
MVVVTFALRTVSRPERVARGWPRCPDPGLGLIPAFPPRGRAETARPRSAAAFSCLDHTERQQAGSSSLICSMGARPRAGRNAGPQGAVSDGGKLVQLVRFDGGGSGSRSFDFRRSIHSP